MTAQSIIKMEKKYEEAINIAKKGTHCGMCRFDFLDTGLCPSGKKYGFLAYWPQGRMQIFKNLMSGKVKPTKKLIDDAIALVNINPIESKRASKAYRKQLLKIRLRRKLNELLRIDTQ